MKTINLLMTSKKQSWESTNFHKKYVGIFHLCTQIFVISFENRKKMPKELVICMYILFTFFTIRQFMLCSFRIRFWMSWARYYKTWFVVCRCQEYVWLILSSVSEILVGNTTKLLLQKRLKNSWKYYVNRKMFLLVFVEKKSLTSLIFFIFVTYSKWLLFQVSRLIDYGSLLKRTSLFVGFKHKDSLITQKKCPKPKHSIQS